MLKSLHFPLPHFPTMDIDLIEYEFRYSYSLSIVAQKEAAAYFLLHYSGRFLKQRCADYGKVIYKDGTPYIMIWPSDAYQNEAYAAARVAISYRRRKNCSSGYAIPKILYGSAPLDRAA